MTAGTVHAVRPDSGDHLPSTSCPCEPVAGYTDLLDPHLLVVIHRVAPEAPPVPVGGVASRASERPMNEVRWGSTRGRFRRRAVGHPAASPSGVLRRARAVLFDAIGPGAHPCDVCGRPVVWGGRGPAMLVADHRNGDTTDDRPANLRALCTSCSSRDGAQRRWARARAR